MEFQSMSSDNYKSIFDTTPDNSTYFNVDDAFTPPNADLALFHESDYKSHLPYLKTRPPHIFTKRVYTHAINPVNDKSSPFYHQSERGDTPPQNYRYPSELYYSPYGPAPTFLCDIPGFEWIDHHLNTNPGILGNALRRFAVRAFHTVARFGIRRNHTHIHGNDLVSPVIDGKNRPVITYSNHNSTIDDPYIISAMKPDLNADTCRWVICGQDICYPSTFIGMLFIAGQVMPIQRGAGLFQPHFLRTQHLVSQNKWIHIFPEGRVVFTPTYDGLDHDLRDPPQQLQPFKWGVASLITESVLRGEEPAVFPVTHTTARVMPRSNGVPDLGHHNSINIAADVLPWVRSPIDDYVTHVQSFEQLKIPYAPQKEDTMIEVTNRLKHILDWNYTYVESKDRHPSTGEWKSVAPSDRKTLADLDTHQQQQNTQAQTPQDGTSAISPLKCPENCYCRHSDEYPLKQRILKHGLLAHYMKMNQNGWNTLQPWFNITDSTAVHSLTAKSQSADQHQQQQQPASSPAQTGGSISIDTLGDFYHKYLQLTAVPPREIQKLNPLNTAPTALASLPNSEAPKSTSKLDYHIKNHERVSSTHDIPQLYRVKTRKYVRQWNFESMIQNDLSNATGFLIRRKQWGSGKYKLGYDGHYPNIFDLEQNYHEQPDSSLASESQPNWGDYDWFTIWKSRHLPVKTNLYQYVPEQHGFIVDQAAFESTWDKYMQLSYSDIIPQGGAANKTKHDLQQQQMQQQQDAQHMSESSLFGPRDKKYAAEVLVLRNRFDHYRKQNSFDWNGT